MGKLEQGLASCRRAYDLDPLSTYAATILSHVSRALGRESESLAVLERMNQLNPRLPRVYAGLAEHYMLKRDFAKAQEMLTKGLEINPRELSLRLNQGLLYAFTERRKEALEVMHEMMRDKSESVSLYGQLFISSVLGNFDEAFKALMRMAELHNWPFLIGSLAVFEELRKDQRYREFCAKVGLPR